MTPIFNRFLTVITFKYKIYWKEESQKKVESYVSISCYKVHFYFWFWLLHIEVLLCGVHKYLWLLYLLLGLIPSWIDDYAVYFLSLVTVFILKSILSDMNIASPDFFWFPFTWNIFFHSLTFSLYVSLGLKLVSCRQHIYGLVVSFGWNN